MKHFLRRQLYVLREFGFDPVKFWFALTGVVWYLRDLINFKYKLNQRKVKYAPIFSDRSAFSGNANGHYFWQDLICARWIFENSPTVHLDVGSRIDGFIAHLLTFMEVHQIDVRENPFPIKGFKTIVADLTQNFIESESKFQSVSSLHSLEHFGLGRYGDKLLPKGHEIGLSNLASYVAPGGYLYISHPVGKETVQFNAQRLLPADWVLKVLVDFEPLEYVNIPWKGLPTFHSGYPIGKHFSTGSAILIKLRKL